MIRYWVFSFTEKLLSETERQVESGVKNFLREWDSHGVLLDAEVSILDRQVLIIHLKDKDQAVSGCAVDTLNRKIREILEGISLKLSKAGSQVFETKSGLVVIERNHIAEALKNGKLDENAKILELNVRFDESKQISQVFVPIKETWVNKYFAN